MAFHRSVSLVALLLLAGCGTSGIISAIEQPAVGTSSLRPETVQTTNVDAWPTAVSSFSVGPQLDLNSVDGLAFGPKFSWTHGTHGDSWRSRLSTSATIATRTWGLAGFFDYKRRKMFGNLDGAIRLEGQTPNRERRVYGLGNDTPFLETDIAALRYAHVELKPRVGMSLENGFSWQLGGALRHTDLGPPHPASVAPAQNALEPENFIPKTHVGGSFHLGLTHVKGRVFPIRGFRIEGQGDVRAALVDSAGTYGALEGSGTVHIPFSQRQPVVLALRIGGEHRIGDFPVYDAAAIGGNTLRRYYGNRFSGRTAAYGNAELRFRFATLEMFPIPIDLGALGFADVGRVWIEEDPSRTWHVGGGGGLWLGLMNDLVGQGMLYATEDGLGLTAGLGFRF